MISHVRVERDRAVGTARVPRELKLHARIGRVCTVALLQRPAGIIHPRREVSRRIKERIDYRFISILRTTISHRVPNERVSRNLDGRETERN